MVATKTRNLPAAPATKELELEAKAIGMVALEDLHDSPFNPRRRYDEKGLEELADSYRLCPSAVPELLVRPRPNGGEGVQMIFGHRRKRAAARAGLTELPCKLIDVDDHVARALQWAENATREALHPIDEADSFAAWMREPGTTVEAIACEIGRPPAFVRSRVKLAGLIPAARTALEGGRIGLGVAQLVAGLASAEDQVKALDHALSIGWGGKPPATDAVAAWVEGNLTLDLARAPWALDDESLVLGAGPCTGCVKRTGATADLFAGVVAGDRCLDKTCWAEKLDAHVAERKKAGDELLEVSPSYGTTISKEGDALPNGCWAEVKTEPTARELEDLREDVRFELVDGTDDQAVVDEAKLEQIVAERVADEFGPCEHARQALVKKGPEKGQVKLVCTEPTCARHGHQIVPPTIEGAQKKASRLTTTDWEAENKKRQEKAAAERKVRVRAMREALDRLKLAPGGLLKHAELALMLAGRHVSDEDLKEVLDWERPKNLAAVEASTLSKALLVEFFGDDLHGYRDGAELLAFVKRNGVDVKKVRAAIAAEEKASAEPKASKASAKKPTKKKAKTKAKR